MPRAPSCISAVSSKSSNNSSGKHAVGWVKDAHGLKGELYIQLYANTADWLESAESLYLENEEGEFSEWKLEKAKPFKDGLIVKFEGLSDRTPAEKLRKFKVFIDESLLVSEPGEAVYLKQLKGFMVVDKGQEIGRVTGFASNGPQDLLCVERSGRAEALIPLVDAYILSIDFDNDRLEMDLPPGLLDVEEK